MTKKKVNLQDATLINIRVTRRSVAALELRVRDLESAVVQLLAATPKAESDATGCA